MDFIPKNRSIYSLLVDFNNGKYNLDHPLQRPSGQWNRKQQSLLIDSLLRPYPINPIHLIDEGFGHYSVIDAKQRISAICSYLNNEFALSKGLKEVVLEKGHYTIAGKKYNKLDQMVKDYILKYEVQMYIYSDCTEEDIKELFSRLNSGKPLNNTQKLTSYMSSDVNKTIYDISNSEFFSNFLTKTQKKSSYAMSIITEVLMLSEMSNYSLTSFKHNDKEKFIEWYNDNISEERVEIIKKALDKLNDNFNSDIVKFPKTSISFIIYGMYKTLKNKGSASKYVELINEFLSGYSENTDYLQYCSNGTSNSNNVNGRLEYFKKLIANV